MEAMYNPIAKLDSKAVTDYPRNADTMYSVFLICCSKITNNCNKNKQKTSIEEDMTFQKRAHITFCNLYHSAYNTYI